MSDTALMVFTFKSRDHLLTIGGTASWSLNPATVRKCKYVVCTRNTDPKKSEQGANEPHGTAFLVGRISGLVKHEERNGRQRYLVACDAFADVLVPNVWDGSRSPTRYVALETLKDKGLDIESLTFVPVVKQGLKQHEPALSVSAPVGHIAPLTIAEAKRGLAAKFAVAEEEIEITIKG